MIWLASIGLALIVAALLLRWYALGTAARLNLPGELFYSDGDSTADVLVSDTHRLVGKPDYILERDGELIPVERKSRSLSGAGAYEGEKLQLAAYCLLVEERFGRPIRRGKLQYQNKRYRCENSSVRDRRHSAEVANVRSPAQTTCR
jgi:CRISPR-associated exonuclease Cas4